MKYSVEQHHELHKKRCKKHGLTPIQSKFGFKYRYNLMASGEITYDEMIQTPTQIREFSGLDKPNEFSTLKRKCEFYGFIYLRVWKYLRDNGISFENMLELDDLSEFYI